MRLYGFTRYGGPEVEAFLEVPEPSATAHGALVRTVAVGLNPADIKVRAGQRVGKVPVSFPMAMGREAAGTVVHDPSGTFETGARVFGSCAAGTGALAELTLLDPAQTAAIPPGVTPEQAAVIPVAIGTAWDALHELAVGPADTVLVLGAGGGVGIHGVQLARHLGATVLAAVRPAKVELVTRYGARPVVTDADWHDRAPNEVTAILDTVGDDLLARAAGLLRIPGRLRSTATPALAAELGGSGVTRRRDAAVYAELAAMVAAGRLHPVIERALTFDDAPAATRAVATGHATGKTVVTL